MKTVDFFCLNRHVIQFFFVGVLICHAGPTLAEPPAPEAFSQSSDLVLTLSDKWLESDTNSADEFHKPARNLITAKSKPKPANIGCGMDVNSLPTDDDSIASRVEGKCNFNYHY